MSRLALNGSLSSHAVKRPMRVTFESTIPGGPRGEIHLHATSPRVAAKMVETAVRVFYRGPANVRAEEV